MILGIDPGLEVTGWCLLSRSRKCDSYGGVQSDPRQSDNRRIAEICGQLLALLHQMRVGGADPSIASVEQYVYQGPRSQTSNAFRVSRLVGAIESLYRGEDITVVGPTRGQALMSIGCRPNAAESDAKRVIGLLVKSRGGLSPSNEHTRAAFAAAWWAVGRTGRK